MQLTNRRETLQIATSQLKEVTGEPSLSAQENNSITHLQITRSGPVSMSKQVLYIYILLPHGYKSRYS